jgi:hypothetical protein
MLPVIRTRISNHLKNILLFRIVPAQNEGFIDEDESLITNYFWKFTE